MVREAQHLQAAMVPQLKPHHLLMVLHPTEEEVEDTVHSEEGLLHLQEVMEHLNSLLLHTVHLLLEVEMVVDLVVVLLLAAMEHLLKPLHLLMAPHLQVEAEESLKLAGVVEVLALEEELLQLPMEPHPVVEMAADLVVALLLRPMEHLPMVVAMEAAGATEVGTAPHAHHLLMVHPQGHLHLTAHLLQEAQSQLHL